MNTAIVGIDPGLTGAWAAIRLDDGSFVDADDLPRFQRKINGIELANTLKRCRAAHLVVEAVHSMPGQGVASAFTFGESFGTVLGVACGLGLPYTLTSPHRWKSHFHLAGKPKDASRELVLRLYPGAAPLLKLKRHHGRADAILIARHHFDLQKQGRN